MDAPLFEQDMRFSERVEDFTVRQFNPEPGVKEFFQGVRYPANWTIHQVTTLPLGCPLLFHF